MVWFHKKTIWIRFFQGLQPILNSPMTPSIFSKKFCVYKYVYVLWGQTENVTHIGVGLIKNGHGNSSSADTRFDIWICPPNDAKPQQESKRPDTLYKMRMRTSCLIEMSCLRSICCFINCSKLAEFVLHKLKNKVKINVKFCKK